MRKFLVSFFVALMFVVLGGHIVLAAESEYVITNFRSDIALQKDTSLLVQETIEAYFNVYKHGIFRIIPVVYSARGKTIKADFNLISIVNEDDVRYSFEKSRLGQSVKLKIGDPNKTITGPQTYIITYEINNVVQRFDDHDEIYWNVTGSEWDTEILNSSVTLSSSYATITNTECFAGVFKTTKKKCT